MPLNSGTEEEVKIRISTTTIGQSVCLLYLCHSQLLRTRHRLTLNRGLADSISSAWCAQTAAEAATIARLVLLWGVEAGRASPRRRHRESTSIACRDVAPCSSPMDPSQWSPSLKRCVVNARPSRGEYTGRGRRAPLHSFSRY